jgi:hypothetical protein
MKVTKGFRKNRTSIDACRSGVIARYETLTKALRSLDSVPAEFITSTVSAVQFARLSCTSCGITPIARNTLFKYADEILSDRASENGQRGWKLLDSLRIAVYKKATNESRRRSSATRTLRQNSIVESLTSELEEMQRCILAQTNAYLALLKEVGGLAKSEVLDNKTRFRLKNMLGRHDELYSELFEARIAKEIRPQNVEVLK